MARKAFLTPEERHARKLARAQRWRLEDPERYKASKKASDKKYHEANREHLLAQMRRKNQARVAAMTPEELAEHQARKNASMRLFYRAHTEEISRRKTIRGVKAEQRRLVIAAAKGICAYCQHYNPTCKQCPKGTHELTVDHITAIVKGGDSSLHNLIACCRSCNAKKHARPTPIMVQPLLL